MPSETFKRLHELRQRILGGEDAQITIEAVNWDDGHGNITQKRVGRLRLRPATGRLDTPDLELYANPENGPEDAASIVESFGRWLAAGRGAGAAS